MIEPSAILIRGDICIVATELKFNQKYVLMGVFNNIWMIYKSTKILLFSTPKNRQKSIKAYAQ
jgi:hypothetical protein